MTGFVESHYYQPVVAIGCEQIAYIHNNPVTTRSLVRAGAFFEWCARGVGVPFREVHNATWKKSLGRVPAFTDYQDKREAQKAWVRQRVCELHPGLSAGLDQDVYDAFGVARSTALTYAEEVLASVRTVEPSTKPARRRSAASTTTSRGRSPRRPSAPSVPVLASAKAG